MNNTKKITAIALFSFLLMGCDKITEMTSAITSQQEVTLSLEDVKKELQVVDQLDNAFVQQMAENQDETKILPLLEETQKKYVALDLKDKGVQHFRDLTVEFLKSYTLLIKQATEVKTEEDKKSFLAAQEKINEMGKELKQTKFELIQKLNAEQQK